uniref:Uncharacterized protein n=1 Tax=Anopheles minimus TaxID=112268 RepID=A0A182WPD8_9DIPT
MRCVTHGNGGWNVIANMFRLTSTDFPRLYASRRVTRVSDKGFKILLRSIQHGERSHFEDSCTVDRVRSRVPPGLSISVTSERRNGTFKLQYREPFSLTSSHPAWTYAVRQFLNAY